MVFLCPIQLYENLVEPGTPAWLDTVGWEDRSTGAIINVISIINAISSIIINAISIIIIINAISIIIITKAMSSSIIINSISILIIINAIIITINAISSSIIINAISSIIIIITISISTHATITTRTKDDKETFREILSYIHQHKMAEVSWL